MPTKKAKPITKIADLTPDQRNANKGTLRGLAMLEDSIAKYGAGRSILVDKSGNVIAGNKTLQAAADAGFGIEVVASDGKKLIVVQRTDLDINSIEGRELALADNRVSEVDLDFDVDVIKAMSADGVNLAPFWNEGELAILFGNFAGQGLDGNLDVNSQFKNAKGRKDGARQIKLIFGEISTVIGNELYDQVMEKLKTYPDYRAGIVECLEAFIRA